MSHTFDVIVFSKEKSENSRKWKSQKFMKIKWVLKMGDFQDENQDGNEDIRGRQLEKSLDEDVQDVNFKSRFSLLNKVEKLKTESG